MKHLLVAALAANVMAFTGSVAFATVTANFTPLAGEAAILDHTNGTYTNARFYNPVGVAVDSSGNVYVADTSNHTVDIVTAGGASSVLAGVAGTVGNVDSSQGTPLLGYPYAVAVDANQNVYVTDILDNSVRKITSAGVVTTVATGFNNPEGIAVDSLGNVYVSDTNNSVIKKIVLGTGAVSVYAGSLGVTGSANGAVAGSTFNYPAGIATDASGNVYVADYDNSLIRLITVATGQVSTLAGNGSASFANGANASASFNHPADVTVDTGGNVYVVDTSNQLIRRISGGAVTTVAGTFSVTTASGVIGSANGAGTVASFFYPQGIAAAPNGSVYVADTGNHEIRLITTPTSTPSVSNYAGSEGAAGFTNGAALSSTFQFPNGTAVDGSGNVYIADAGNNAIRKLSGGSGGTVTTLAGTGVAGFANGATSVATFSDPNGVAVDGSGNVYVADTGNSAIRKIAGGLVSTLLGGFNQPQGVAVDAAGNVYVADTNNDIIVKIAVTNGVAGAVTTLAGSSGNAGSTDSTTGTSARFNRPNALTVDAAGNIFVGDSANYTIRKIAAAPPYAVTTIAGTAGQVGLSDGQGSAARFNQTYGVAVDNQDNVYVADSMNSVVRQVSSTGYVTTVTGSQARFFYPEGVALDSSGNLYVVDSDNNSLSEGAVAQTTATGLANHTVVPGGAATFTVLSPIVNASYTWQVSTNGGVSWSTIGNGGVYSGATTTALTITGATAGMNGYDYRAVAVASGATSYSPTGTLYVGNVRIVNLSSRGFVGTGTSDMDAGFIINGSGNKQLLIRGIGPTLASFGITGTLANPMLTLYTSAGAVQSTNTVWGGSTALQTAMSAVGAFALPVNSADSVLYLGLGNGSHTATVDGVGGSTGVALVEVYDADTGTPATRLSNISTRAPVGTANLVAGFVISGNTSETVLIRGVGPGLGALGVANVLSNVLLTLYDGNANVITSNNGWGGGTFLSTTFTNVGAFSLPAGSQDSALVVTLAPGNYTAQVSGAGGATGTALVEIYEVP